MVTAAVQQVTGLVTPREFLSDRSPTLVVGAFVLAIIGIGTVSGSLPAAIAVAGLLTLGSVASAFHDQPLTLRQTPAVGAAHLLGAIVLAF